MFSYSSPRLAIYDDRIEIENPGRLPLGVTPENIKEFHSSKPYNPLIASVLYRTSWLESWGSGVKRMIDACKSKGLPEPYYVNRPGDVVIIFQFNGDIQATNCESNCESIGNQLAKCPIGFVLPQEQWFH